MGKIMIKAENISKHYRLGAIGSGSLKQDLKEGWNKLIRPNKNTLLPGDLGYNNEATDLWALKNVSFDVKQGEVMGFVGKNGAGKSTLLKVLSRITLPTTGRVLGNGKIASLLEVGTGFHQELTGRENIYLNGQILGMKKHEINARFDEIVAFSGVSRFLDTPVKRYSSGMYVRLAFAVAAHLDPEILIVDEVLAVGDVEFQRKCLGKMKEISTEYGKTVLFVSHNLSALRSLCSHAIFLHQGQVVDYGQPDAVIANYLNRERFHALQQHFEDPAQAPGNSAIRIQHVAIEPQYLEGQDIVDVRTPLLLRFAFHCHVEEGVKVSTGIHLFTHADECIFDVSSEGYQFENGLIEGECLIPGNFLNDGSYYISIDFVRNLNGRLFYYERCLSFDVEDYRENTAWFGKWKGYVRPQLPVLLRANTGAAVTDL